MGKSLVIVESRAKANTIGKFLGSNYAVRASNGHVRDLPKKELGIDLENGFKPTYVAIRGKSKILKTLKEAARKSDTVYLASDFDREGEAIAWHITTELRLPREKIRRVVFNEITKRAILAAMEQPGEIDMHKVDAQQARRVLDRIVGYMVSPVLWKTIHRGLSAGRVQSVALRLICEREDDIESFVPREFWTVDATFVNSAGEEFGARLEKIDGKKAKIEDGDVAHGIVRDLKDKTFTVTRLDKKERKVNPLPPFITSTLQRDAANRLRFSSKKTMMIAQQLYEGLEVRGENVGLITYMRTDSIRIAEEALDEARLHITESLGKEFLPKSARRYRASKGAQDAHEAIRPTSVAMTPDQLRQYLARDQLRLYELIWRRFVACQMTQARYEKTTVHVESERYLFKAEGSVSVFPGWTSVYPAVWEELSEIPALSEGERLSVASLAANQRFTKPHARYTEATLIKELESKGIGRPSTYATIVDTLKKRKYAQLDKRRFTPTELGRTVWNLLADGFPDIFDVEFTARMETDLDKVETGEDDWVTVVRDFYDPFKTRLEEVQGRVKELKQALVRETDKRCEKCGGVMIEKWGRHGRFLACSGYPKCKFTMPLEDEKLPEFDVKCPKCGAPMVVKHGPFGKFLGCSRYPECRSTAPLPTGIPCPEESCTGMLVQRRTKRGKIFYGCSAYPQCGYAIWDKPVAVTCPVCQAGFMVEKNTKRDGKTLVCLECGEKIPAESEGD